LRKTLVCFAMTLASLMLLAVAQRREEREDEGRRQAIAEAEWSRAAATGPGPAENHSHLPQRNEGRHFTVSAPDSLTAYRLCRCPAANEIR